MKKNQSLAVTLKANRDAAAHAVTREAKGAKPILPPRKVEKKAKKAPGPRKPPSGHQFHPALVAWARNLNNPHEKGVRMPVNYNTSPSLVSLTAQTTMTRQNISVAPSKTMMFAFFGSSVKQGTGATEFDNWLNSGGYQTCGSGDLESVHTRLLGWQFTAGGLSGAVTGPVAQDLEVNVAGVPAPMPQTPICCLAAECSSGNASNFLGNGGLNWASFSWDNPTGMTSAPREGHLRSRLVSLGIEVINVTPELNRAGSITSVSPTDNFYDAGTGATGEFPLSRYSKYSSYRVTSDRQKIRWRPRSHDLAYAHCVMADPPVPSLVVAATSQAYVYNDGAVVMVFLDNPSPSNAQQFSIACVANWELAGAAAQVLGSPSLNHPQLKGAVDVGITHAANSDVSPGESILHGALLTAQQGFGAAVNDAVKGATGLVKSALGTAAAGVLA